MNWLTMIWAAGLGACLTLGLMHFSIWWRDRKAWAQLTFFLTTLGLAGLAGCEMGTIKATTAGAFADWVRYAHVATGFFTVGAVAFVYFYFGTASRWLLGACLLTRGLAVLMNFASGTSLHFESVTSIERFTFLGELVSMPGVAAANRWLPLGPLAALTLLIYVVHAAIRLWRKGTPEERQRALVVGSAFVVFLVLSSGHSALIAKGVLKTPFMVSLPFMAIVLAMGIELSHEVLQAARTALELKQNKARLTMAATAARLALWEWDIPADTIWVSGTGTILYGVPEGETVNIQKFEDVVHPDDRSRVRVALERAIAHGDPYAAEYRVILPDGANRWISALGKVDHDTEGHAILLRGVSMDVTERKLAEEESIRQRNELAHLSRVATLGELSGSLAHELNQPLAIVLSNAQAAQRLLGRAEPDLAEVRDILDDIISEDRRAGEVIKRLRALLKHGETNLQSLSLEVVVGEVLALMRSDLIDRGMLVEREFPSDLQPVSGDPVQLQQVVLNLVLNACEAMTAAPSGQRVVHLSAVQTNGQVRLSVLDQGCGLPEGAAGRIFEPFYTTKSEGLGMGLAICRSIAVAHGGHLTAESLPVGSVFHLDLPAAKPRT
jgi:PAS domain S-box-containing protein